MIVKALISTTPGLRIENALRSLFQAQMYKLFPQEHDNIFVRTDGKPVKGFAMGIHYSINKGVISFSFVSPFGSYLRMVAEAFAAGDINLGKIHFAINKVWVEEPNIHNGKWIFDANMVAMIGNSANNHYLHPHVPVFFDRIKEIALRKAEALMMHIDEFDICALSVHRKRYAVYKGTKIWYSPATYMVRGNEETLKKLACLGFGSKNSLGFGAPIKQYS